MTETAQQKMIPPIERFIGALQGGVPSSAGNAGEIVLSISESLLANGELVVKEVEKIVQDLACSDDTSVVLWRAVPIGLFYYRDLDLIETVAEKACRLSHGDPEDIASVVGMALTVARLIRMGEMEPLQFAREMAWFCRKFDANAYDRLMEIVPLLKGKEEIAIGTPDRPLGHFRAALSLFLSCEDGDLDQEATVRRLQGAPALPLAYTMAGSLGRICRIEQPSLRVLRIAEEFQGRNN
jgi:hypothetical protein